MFIADDGSKYEDELEYLETLKCDDSYSFTENFLYILDGYDSEDDDSWQEGTIEIEITWDSSIGGYTAEWDIDNEGEIAADNRNSIEEIVENALIDVSQKMQDMGVSAGAIAFL